VCGPGVVKRYLSKISGPLLDRINLHVEVTLVSYEEPSSHDLPAKNSKEISTSVVETRKVQAGRFNPTWPFGKLCY
jgi:magnesium chelatase family protein